MDKAIGKRKPTPLTKSSRTRGASVRRKSAVSRVERIGYDLVKCRPIKGTTVTVKDAAKMTFEAWAPEPDGKLIPSDEKMSECTAICRVAHAVMLRNREELIEMHGNVEHKDMDLMVAKFAEISERLKGLILMLDGAYYRVFASAAAATKRGIIFPGIVGDLSKTRRKA